VDRDASDVVAHQLDLARVQAGPHLDSQRRHRVGDRPRALGGAGRPVEDRQEAVAGGLHLAPSKRVSWARVSS
jgi:hypothetical protein